MNINMNASEECHYELPIAPEDMAAIPKESAADRGDMAEQKATEKKVTTEMELEEEELNKASTKQEMSLLKDSETKWREMETSDRQERFRKLNSLLYKSNRYTEYLITRIKAQEAEEEEKRARIRARKEELRLQRENRGDLEKELAPSLMRKSARQVEKQKTPIDLDNLSATQTDGKHKRRGRKRKVLEEVDVNTEPNDVNTEPKDANTEPKYVNTEPNDVNTEPKDVNTEPKDANTEPKYVNTEPKYVNTEPNDINKEPKDTNKEPKRSRTDDSRTSEGSEATKSESRPGDRGDTNSRETGGADKLTHSGDSIEKLSPGEGVNRAGTADDEQSVCDGEENVANEQRQSGGTSGNIDRGDGVSDTSKGEDLADGELVEKEKRYIDGQIVPDDQPSLFTGGILRPYQLVGYHWLKTLYQNGVNGILADEMGLGKTAQTIATMCYLVENKVEGPYLICAPLSTLTNWIAEFNRFAPAIPVVLYHGAKEKRAELRRFIGRSRNIGDYKLTRPVIVTSYEIAIKDKNFLKNYMWKYLVVDEGQRIKNHNCLLVQQLRLYPTTNRLLLTGTPLQNNLTELWSLLNFLLPVIFDDLDSFNAWFDVDLMTRCDDEFIAHQAQRENILDMLHQILSPFMLRRLKTDVELLIPPKKEVLVYAPLVEAQYKYYKALLDRSLKRTEKKETEQPKPVELNSHGRPVRRATRSKVNYSMMMEDAGQEKGNAEVVDVGGDDEGEEEVMKWFKDIAQFNKRSEDSGNRGKNTRPTEKTHERNFSLMNIMMHLRKTCNHPYLIEYPLTESHEYKIDEDIVTSCGKMMILDRMLTELRKRKHKVLIFSQMTRMLDIIQDYCTLRSLQFSRLDGSTGLEERQEQINEFSTDPEKFLFLLSTRAGGLGINLTAADTVIIYDSDWNPQVDLQAQDRCHRIGQTSPVVVYRYVTANSVDQNIVERAAGKRKLEKMVIQKGKFRTGVWNPNSKHSTAISQEELLALLRTTDHSEVVKGRGDQVISNRDLEALLDRSDLYDQWQDDMDTTKNQIISKTSGQCEESKDI